jgi:hypothetical protein
VHQQALDDFKRLVERRVSTAGGLVGTAIGCATRCPAFELFLVLSEALHRLISAGKVSSVIGVTPIKGCALSVLGSFHNTLAGGLKVTATKQAGA